MKTTFSICLTVHNKEQILQDVLDRLYLHTKGSFEFIFVLDGCTDKSDEILLNTMRANSHLRISTKVMYLNNVFETKANNAALKRAIGEYCVLVQDDMLIDEAGWNLRMLEPFKKFSDVFAVTARTAHNWKLNEDSFDINTKAEDFDVNRWSDVLIHCDHAHEKNTERNIFAVRDSVNRGPLMICASDLQKLNYLDEAYAPQENDDHDLAFRAKKQLGKVCGYYGVSWFSKPEYGGTRDENGNTKKWLFKANHKNSLIFAERHKNDFKMTIENRTV